MITVKSREHSGQEILINEDNIQYISPSISGETVVYFSETNFLVISEPFDTFKRRFSAKPRITLEQSFQPDESAKVEYKDLDQYPENLPRLPTGYVDKRTTAYKEYIAGV
jgi:hypothetical protein